MRPKDFERIAEILQAISLGTGGILAVDILIKQELIANPLVMGMLTVIAIGCGIGSVVYSNKSDIQT